MAKKKATKSEAGRKGGRATLMNHGPDFFRRIGSKGGKAKKHTR